MPGETVLVIDDSPTILKVVQLVLTKAGYTVKTAPDGEEGIAAAIRDKPSIILLDFVMPKMNGYQVCRALADDANLRDVPVVLMSAKGDQVGERFVKVMGIVDYITKPFSPDAIAAVVAHTLARRGQLAGSDVASSAPTHIAALESGPALIRDERLSRALERVRDGVVEVLSRSGLSLGVLADEIRARLDDKTLAEILRPAVAVLSSDEGVSLRGELAAVPIGEVLSLLQHQRQWGVLSVETSAPAPKRVDVFFKQGRIELALSAGLGEEFQLGRYLVDLNLLAEADLDEILASHSTDVPLGERLVKEAKLKAPDLQQGLRRQAQERIYELLKWPSGSFAFAATRELPPLAIDAALALDIEGLLMEGFRRVDEWHLIEREIDDFDAVFLRNEEAVQNIGKARLVREELAVLELITGKNSVKDVVRLSRMSTFDVSKILYRLLSVKLIRRRIAPVAV